MRANNQNVCPLANTSSLSTFTCTVPDILKKCYGGIFLKVIASFQQKHTKSQEKIYKWKRNAH